MSNSIGTQSKKSNDGSIMQSSSDAMKIAGEKMATVASSAAETAKEYGKHYVGEPTKDIVSLLQDYAKNKPEVAAMWCFGIGFFVGWKLRP